MVPSRTTVAAQLLTVLINISVPLVIVVMIFWLSFTTPFTAMRVLPFVCTVSAINLAVHSVPSLRARKDRLTDGLTLADLFIVYNTLLGAGKSIV
jgi:hypothetical protein